MGRHSRPSHSLRNTLLVSSAITAGLGTVLAVPASADTLDGCTASARNPDVRICQDDPYTDGSDSLHALAKANPLLCLHVAIPDGRRAVGTRDCSHPVGVVPVVPVYPVAPGGTAPCACTTPGGTAPVAPVTSPGSETPVTAPAPAAPAPEAPAPTIINNNTATSPLPAVTH